MRKVGKPSTIKQINQGIIRDLFLRREALTCSEIARQTGISITTARAVMGEMLGRGELRSLGLGPSSGGRKSEQFVIDDDCYEGLSLCVTDRALHIARVNIHAESARAEVIPLREAQDAQALLPELIAARLREKTRAIGIGVPGIVTTQGYLQKSGAPVALLPALRESLSLPIVLENDLRASALGFSRETGAGSTVAFLHLESSCGQISAGFVEGDKILRGVGNFAGELGLMPFDGDRDFCEALYRAHGEGERADILARLVAWVCCAVNPQKIVLCGDGGLAIDPAAIRARVTPWLPETMLPELSIGTDFVPYFQAGMAALTARAIFSEEP